MTVNGLMCRLAKRLIIISLAFVSFSSFTNACVVCVPYPTKSIADYIVDSETVVLARENPNKPWSYIAVETLKGKQTVTPIDHFLNSSTRRMLNLHPDQGVLFVQESKDDLRWHNLGFVEADYEKVIRMIIQLAPAWKKLIDSNESRLRFFSQYLGHENYNVHTLAYLEIGRACYDQINSLDTNWTLADIRTQLRNPIYTEWQPLAILILAQKGNASDQEYIIKKFSSYARNNLTINLSAWATAFIEIKEKQAVREIEKHYFRLSTRKLDELKAVTAALSEHGNFGHKHLRDQIVMSYSTLLEFHPEMAGYVTRDLLAWQRWELSDQLAKILNTKNQVDPLGAYVIKQYLYQAERFHKS